MPSAYGLPGVAVTVGSARSTGASINELIDSNIIDLNITPSLQITSEPLDAVSVSNRNAILSTTAALTDGTTSSISYQWQLNGTDVNDGTYNLGTAIKPSSAVLTVIDDSSGKSEVINFSQLSSYSGFAPGKSYTITSNIDFNCKIYAIGAGGAGRQYYYDNNRTGDEFVNISGSAGGSAQGTFTFKSGTQYKLIVGSKGTREGRGGFGGGGDSIAQSLQSGRISTFNSGSGGGGHTGLFLTSVDRQNSILIAGGGGGSYSGGNLSLGNGGGTTGTNTFTNSAGTQTRGGISNISGGFLDVSSGGSGSTRSVDTNGTSLAGGYGFGSFYNTSTLRISSGYGAGGGGGYYGGAGTRDGNGGGGSGYLHPTLITNGLFSRVNSATENVTYEDNGSFRIEPIAENINVNVSISGTKTPNLTIQANFPSLYSLKCRASHPTAFNSPVFSRSANFTVVDARQILNFESVNDNGGFSNSGSVNLFNNPTTFSADPNNTTRSLVIYPPEKDIRVRITLAAGAGASRRSRGGEGGLSVFEYTLKQNTEYTLKLGAATQPTGGANGGGGAAYLYEKARLIAVCGGGGGSGTTGRGGDGGGIGVGGEFGQGRNGGAGGRVVTAGNLSTGSGSFSSRSSGGQVSGCTIGDYYRSVGFSPCQDVGQQQWRGASGNIASQTAVIQRGYKAGLGYRNNGGNGGGNEGGGGSGAYGGNAAVGDGSGGGGGSGYTDGSIVVISTRLGGNNSTNAFARIEIFV